MASFNTIMGHLTKMSKRLQTPKQQN